MATYKADPLHSEVKFKVKHLMISTVTGEFKTFDATLTAEKDDFSDAQISFTADVNSINTNQEQRDTHLKSDDFFSAEKYPQILFSSTSFEPKGNGAYVLIGNMTIRDITKPIVLAVEYGGSMVDFYGNIKHGFEISGTLHRKEFGLQWDAITEAGGVVVADEVKLLLSIQMAKQ